MLPGVNTLSDAQACLHGTDGLRWLCTARRLRPPAIHFRRTFPARHYGI